MRSFEPLFQSDCVENRLGGICRKRKPRRGIEVLRCSDQRRLKCANGWHAVLPSLQVLIQPKCYAASGRNEVSAGHRPDRAYNNENESCAYWTKELGASEQKLRDAVVWGRVMVSDVGAYLKK